jgi:hypothetical protein
MLFTITNHGRTITVKPKKFSMEFFQQAGAIGGRKGGKTKTEARLKALAKARRVLAAKRKKKGANNG